LISFRNGTRYGDRQALYAVKSRQMLNSI